MVNKSLPIEKLRKHVVPFAGVAWQFSGSKRHVLGNASLDLEGVGSDGVDGPPQALDGSVVAGGVGAMDTLADMAAAVFDMAARVLAPAGAAPAAAAGAAGAAALGAPAVGAQGAAPVAERAGVTEQRIRQDRAGLTGWYSHRGGAQVSVADVRRGDVRVGRQDQAQGAQ